MQPQILTTDDAVYLARLEDVAVIRDILTERKEPLTLKNALFVLAVGLRNRPDAWTLGPYDLPAYWPPTQQVDQ